MRRAIALFAAIPVLFAPATTAQPRAALTGQPEVIFKWSRDRCEIEDISDIHARAFRDADGQVQLLASHRVTRRLIGPDLDHLRHDCSPVMNSHHDPRPARYDDDEWIAAPYSEDGRTIYALVHEEFHAGEHPPGGCPTPGGCWMHAITSAVSHDGGASYVQRKPPAHLVAAIPLRYHPGRSDFGYTNPSNIARAADGWYYAFINQAYWGAPGGYCLLRTKRLDDPASWRAWNGKEFAFRFRNPYRERIRHPRFCTPVAPGSAESLTWNTYFEKWLLVGTRGEGNPERLIFYFALSDDLIHWSEPNTILDTEARWPLQCVGPAPKIYPSLIDDASPSRSFDVSGRSGWLYYTQFNDCSNVYDRDLLRVRVEFSK